MIRALPLVLLLAACTDFPEVGRAEAALAATSQTPALLTSEQLAALSITTADRSNAPNRSNALAGEAAALRARAERLRRR